MVDLSFAFAGECWLWKAEKAAWHFITLPEDKSEEIKFFRKNLHGQRRGWDMVRVTVTIGKTRWETSIFPSTQFNAYLLPVKADVRKKEKIAVGDTVQVTLKINV